MMHATAALLGMLMLAAPALCEEPPNPNAAATPEWPWAKYGLPPSTNPACIPVARVDWAAPYHSAMLKREPRGDLDVAFLGDSITMMWRTQSGYEGGTPVWEKYYGKLKAANYGISGDRTEHILWRITEGGDLEGVNPRVLVLLIGINNLISGKYTPEQTAEGIQTIVPQLTAKLPHTRVLLLGVFPCWAEASNPTRKLVQDTNAIICKLEDRKRVFYLDIGARFVEPDGSIVKAKLRDLLHLSEQGYEIWASAMQPYLDDLLHNDGKGEIWQQRGAPSTP